MEAALIAALPFREIWAVDFEFHVPPGEKQEPACLVAWELRSGRKIRQWCDEFGTTPPYPTDAGVLFVSYYAPAEINCHRSLGWAVSERVLDLFTEFRNLTNGTKVIAGRGLLGCLVHHGLDHISANEKTAMRDRFIAGENFSTWSEKERREGLDYCETDVKALADLLPRMLPKIDLPRALLRGRYMTAASAMEYAGTPIDTETLDKLLTNWDGIKDKLIADIDKDYGIFDGTTFKADRFEAFLVAHGIPWERLESGKLRLDDNAFRDAAKSQPLIAPIRELRHALSEMKLNSLAVGSDGRNRTMLSPFGTVTARNAPSTTKFIFGPSVWLRGLIKPEPGHGLAYIDWSQQEFAVAAALSGDKAMMESYASGDPYLAFAKQAGAVPADGTKKTHEAERDLFKTCVLGVQYGMGEASLALRISGLTKYPQSTAKDLLAAHRRTYPAYWAWSQLNADHANMCGYLQSILGFHFYATNDTKLRTETNFPVQGNGSELLRLAACLVTEKGIEVCAPIHDAILIGAPLDRLTDDIATTQALMESAGKSLLNGFELRTDVHIVAPDDWFGSNGYEFELYTEKFCKKNGLDFALGRGLWHGPNGEDGHVERYMDKRGICMWERVMKLIREVESNG